MKKVICILAALCLLTCAACAEENGDALAQGTEYTLDLDGDGAPETVSWRIVLDEYDFETIQLDVTGADGSTVGWNSGMLCAYGIHQADLDGDGRIELLVSGDEASADFLTYCLHYENGGLIPLSFPDISRGPNGQERMDAGYGMVTAIGDNRLTLCGSQDALGTYFCTRVLTLTESGFETADDGLWYADWDFSDPMIWEYSSLTVKRELTTIEGQTLAPGDQLLVIATDKVSTVWFQMRDGRVGSLAIEEDLEQGWGMKVNGIPEEECFEMIPYAD